MKEFCLDLLNDKNAVILDTETTGLDGTAEILELSVIDMAGNVLFDSLIRPSIAKEWSGAQRVHGISPAMVVGVDRIGGFVDELWLLLNGKRIAVYNAPYDKRLLGQSLYHAGVLGRMIPGEWVDVMNPYAEYWGAWNEWHSSFTWQSLTNACAQQGVAVENAHRALGDCRMTLALIRKIAGAS